MPWESQPRRSSGSRSEINVLGVRPDGCDATYFSPLPLPHGCLAARATATVGPKEGEGPPRRNSTIRTSTFRPRRRSEKDNGLITETSNSSTGGARDRRSRASRSHSRPPLTSGRVLRGADPDRDRSTRMRSGKRCLGRWSETSDRCRGRPRCGRRRSRCSIRALRPGRISWSRSLWKAMKRVSQSGAGSASSAIRSESGRSWRTSGQHRSDPGERGALVRGAEGDNGVHPLVAPHPLDVVAGDQAAEAVADHVHLLVARLRASAARSRRPGPGRSRGRHGQQAVVERGQVGEPAPAQRPLQQREDGVVVDDAVDQQDRCGRGVDRVVHQSALVGTESAAGRAAGTACGRRLGERARAGTSAGAR